MSFSADEVIGALYRATLNREPDPEGLHAYREHLSANPAALGAIAATFFDSAEHRAALGAGRALPDHSQCGEFAILLRRLVDAGRRHGIVVDVGARGRDRSNSFDLLSQFGWKGILVEANPRLHDEIRAEFAGTDFTLVPCAVGPEEGMLPFYIGANDDVSSLIASAAAGWGDLKGRIEVEVRRLPAILDELAVPGDFDVLSLDIEGVDMPVLNDLIATSPYRPQAIIIEASYGFATKTLAEVHASEAVQAAYEIVGQTEVNLILGLRTRG